MSDTENYELKITWVNDRIERIVVIYKDGYRQVFHLVHGVTYG